MNKDARQEGTQAEPVKNQQPTQDSFAVSAPAINIPKGGGALRGIGEKFAANPVTGTGSMTVPIATSPGRSGFGPQLSLSYDSGAGNGPFGFGWSLSLPAITRKTDKGLPQYFDAEESDVFLLSGAEDLVPEFKKDNHGHWVMENGKHVLHDEPRTVNGITYTVRRYRPRIEGLFARIERWTKLTDPADTFWRSISKDNITTWYGKTAESRIADTADLTRIFSWLICESYDGKGNVIAYQYKGEDSAGIVFSQAHERNRTADTRAANRYLKRIRYGNHQPYLPELTADLPWPGLPADDKWFFEVVFDYDDGHYHELPPDSKGRVFADANADPPPTAWLVRNDPFSSYRAGFEVRTYRLCQRALLFHHFPGESDVGANCLVRSTDFTYSYEQDPGHARNPVYTFLLSVTQSGYKRQNGGYLKRTLPPVEFEYTQPVVQAAVKDVDAESLENLPVGLDGAAYQWTDLHGEGIPGILAEQGGAWFYKRNLSPINVKSSNGEVHNEAKFAAVELVAAKPNLVLAGGQAQFMDLAGDGQPDLVVLDGPMPGLYESDGEEGWQPFRPFVSRLNRDMRDPNLKLVDLDGDGHADVLITEDDAFVWHASLVEEGFGPARRVHQALDEEKGPCLVFADGTQSIYLADLSGDSLSDLVRIRNGEVCYWPNLGYGRFGAKVTMDHAPHFDHPDQFDHKRIRLADIDGTGTTDIIYLHRDGVRLYFNQSGNSWSEPQALDVFPRLDDLVSIVPTDLLGNGTACLVWSSPLANDAGRQMRYIDLMGGQKPHLLVKTVNNLGAETRVHYAPSTRFYLADKAAGTPWITRLPFPVHVVDRVETYDHVSRNRFVTRHAYHHGYFDGEEREFRGFGMVEQWDTEELAALSATGALSDATNIDEASYVPPVLTRTWFHTGAYLDGSRISRQFEDEYYRESDPSLLLEDTPLPADLTAEQTREACRALKGSMLRQEVYALDGTEEADRPYRVSERNYTVKRLQPRADNRHAVFFAHPREAIDFHYERTLYDTSAGKRADPRVSHAVTLDVDDYGNVLLSAAIGYGRRFDDPDPAFTAEDRKKQKKAHVTFTVNAVTEAVLQPDDYRTPLSCESRTFELLNATLASNVVGTTSLFSFDELGALIAQASDGQHDIPYEDVSGAGASGSAVYRRLLEHTRTVYRRDDLTGLLPLGQLQSRALPGESYTQALTTGLLNEVFVAPGTATLPELAALLDDTGVGGYVHSEADANWWIPSGRVFYSVNPGDSAQQELTVAREHFFLPERIQDPFGNAAKVTYDSYALFPAQTEDALENTMAADYDYRVMQPRRMTDPNGNRSEVAFDALGMVAGTAVTDRTETIGDTLAGFLPTLSEPAVLNSIEKPLADPHALLQGATTRVVYDLFAYLRTKNDPQPQPAVVYMLARETHVSDLGPGEQTRVQHSFSYSDGFGREIQKKIQAEPGPLQEGGPDVSPRWVGSGWTIFNNKGKPVRQYEPFFSGTHRFELAHAVGVSPVLFYDPLERVVATLYPDHSWAKVVFDPWRQEAWDGNDTALIADPATDADAGTYFERLAKSDYLPTWHASRIGGTPKEQDAAKKVAAHAGTPAVTHLDTLGRPFLSVADNAGDGKYRTRTELDIEGNQRAVIDALDRIVMRHDYGVAGTTLCTASMEAGTRWMLHDVTGQPIAGWDSRGHRLRYTYDALRRPVEVWLRTDSDPKRLVQRSVYGEMKGEALNHRTRIYQVFDSAGVVTRDEYDFKGNPRRSTRQLAAEYTRAPDWSTNVPLELQVFRTATDFDALNRPIAVTAPDDSVIRPTYNEANLLERLEATLRGSATTTVFVNDVDYDANGQRRVIAYGNGVTSEREYDEKTFRLRRLHTLRGGESLQDLRYTYDPVGNITTITDQAQPTVYFDNAVVSADATYIYDAIYRLIEATGREHVGQLSAPQTSWKDEYRIHLPHPHDGQAMRRYTEHVDYDPVGNILALAHSAPNGSWTRSFTFTEPSQLQAGHTSNRLSTTAVGAVTEGHYTYDAHGNMTRVPHLPLMQWDYLDRLVASSQQVVQSGTPETTYYVYDGAGQRVRKVTERAADSGAAPSRKDERIYLGGFEVYREYGGAGTALQRESLHIVDGESRLALVETRVMGTDGSPPQLIRYQLGNLLGSAALELDDHGQIISYEEYYAYGSTSYQAGRSIAEVSLKRYRYIGKERDEETGLSYHGARYYAPWLGRWTAADRLGFSQPRRTDLNLYAYARGMPSRAVDLSGYAETDKTRAPVRIGKTEVYNPEDMEVVQVSESERVLLPKPGAKPRGTQPQSSRGSATKRPAETPPVPGMMGAPSTGQLQLPPRPGLPPDLRLPPPESTPPPAPVEPPGKVEAPRANPGTPGKIEAPPRIPGRVPLLGAVVAGIVLGFAIAAAEVLLFDNNTERVQQTERLFAQQYEERAAVVLAAGRRPHLRDSTVLKTWEEALKKGRGAVRDPSTREILDAPYYDENGKLIYNWHMGHKEGHEFWRLQIIAEEEGLTWKEVTEIYNDPSHYEPQLPEENISHENESPYVWILPNGRRVGK